MLSTIQINVNVTGTPTDIPFIHSDNGISYPGSFDPNISWRCTFSLPAVSPPGGWGADVHWQNKSQRFIVPSRPGSYEGRLLTPIPIDDLVYDKPDPPFPPIPTREDVCGINLTFQGLTVNLSSGSYPWFELGFQCQKPEDRQIIYSTKKLAGDTHLILQFQDSRPVYNSADEQPYKHMISPDFVADPTSFRNLVREVISNGFTPIVVFDGDNADNEPYGSANALRQLPILANLFQNDEPDLTPYILFARFWDGVFYGSTPENIELFGSQFRHYIPDGYLAIQHNTGHIPVGNGPSDYGPNGMMKDYDVIVSEFGENLSQDSTWQVAGRLLQHYHRPPDQPINDDPHPPFYLTDSARGPRYTCAMEWVGEYYWVRGRTTVEVINQQRSYLKSLGYQYIG